MLFIYICDLFEKYISNYVIFVKVSKRVSYKRNNESNVLMFLGNCEFLIFYFCEVVSVKEIYSDIFLI